MAAIAATAVSLYPTGGAGSFYPGRDQELATKRLKITGVTAADTATAAVLGFSKLVSASSGYNATTPAVVGIGLDPVNNTILIGAGPSNETVYLVVTGTPALAR